MQPQAAADSAALRDEEVKADAAFAARAPSVIWLDESDDEAADSRSDTIDLTETDGEEEDVMIATPSPTAGSSASRTDDEEKEEADVPAPNNVPFDELELLHYRQDVAAAIRASVDQQEGTIVLSSDEEDDGDSDVHAEFDFDDDRMLVDLTDDEDSTVSSQQDHSEDAAQQADEDEDHHSLHLDFDDQNAGVTRVWVEGMDANSVSSGPPSPVSTTSGNSFFTFDNDLDVHLQNQNQLNEEYEEFLEGMEDDLRAMPDAPPLPPHLNVDAYVNADINRREAAAAAAASGNPFVETPDFETTPASISQLAEEMDALIERANFLLGEGKWEGTGGRCCKRNSAASSTLNSSMSIDCSLICGDEPGFFDQVVAQSTRTLSTQSNSPVRIGFGDDDEGFFTVRSPRDASTPVPSEGFTYRDETERFRVPRVILRAIRRLTPPVQPPPQQPEVITLGDSEDDVQVEFEPDVEPDLEIDFEIPGPQANRPPTPVPAGPQGAGAQFAFDFFDGHFEPIFDFPVEL
ncbi:hypothetical protein M3Y99_00136500 [Aphelenchoides fujianensis]|nr:hypothetical protein M3Y99_00136500 [Aphelenchoides fujianensis]